MRTKKRPRPSLVNRNPDPNTRRPTPWKEVLRATFDDVAEALAASDKGPRMVFFWDEVPHPPDNVQKRQGKDTVTEVLNSLRKLSQRHDTIRLLVTGSMGIHHVLRGPWGEGYKGSPLNHMDLIQPGPLRPEHGVPWTRSELSRRELLCADGEACARALSTSVGHVPFYIRKLVDRLPRKVNLTPERIDAAP